MTESESARIVEQIQQLLSEKERVLNYLNSLNDEIYRLNELRVQLQEQYISKLTEQFEMAHHDPQPIIIEDSNDEKEDDDDGQKDASSKSTSETSEIRNPYTIPRAGDPRKPRNPRLEASKRAYKKRCLDSDSSSTSDTSEWNGSD